MSNKKVIFHDLGLIDYKTCWDYQTKLFDETVQQKIVNRKTPSTAKKTSNHLIFCQHPHVYTLGKSGSMSNLLLNEDQLKQRDISFYKINRGGDITYHGPGQLVVYPILDLDHFFSDIHRYLRYLEEAVIKTILEYNIVGKRIEGLTGVWVGEDNPRKICALGVKSSRWVTMHGIGFNVNTDLTYFNNIIPCGIEDKSVTSVQEETKLVIKMDDIKQKLKHYLGEIFEFELIS